MATRKAIPRTGGLRSRGNPILTDLGRACRDRDLNRCIHFTENLARYFRASSVESAAISSSAEFPNIAVSSRSMTSTLRIFVLSCLLVLSRDYLQAADPTNDGTRVGTIAVPDRLTAQEVHQCVVGAAESRGWTIVERDDEHVLVQLLKRKWVARIAIRFTAKELQLFSRSTKGGKPNVPESWIENLKEDIETGLRGTNGIGNITYDASWSNYAPYLQRLIDTVQVQWERLLAESRLYPAVGTSVKVVFRLNSEGKISQIVSVDGTAGLQAEKTCTNAIASKAPYGAWTKEMIALLGESQELTFTFYFQ